MDSGSGSGDGGGLSRVSIVLLLLVGLATAGNFAVQQGDKREGQAVATVDAARADKTKEEKAVEPVYPPPVRPLNTLGSLLGPVVLSSDQRAVVESVAGKLQERGIRMRVLVATVPDWVDSSQQWAFDSIIDALQMSAAGMNYVLTAFDLPDTAIPLAKLEREDQSLRPHAHETTPGTLLFRRAEIAPGQPPTVELLMILLVAETTTHGVHPTAFGHAVDLASLWDELERGSDTPSCEAVRIIGPTYSGSVLSLRLGIEQARTRRPSCRQSPSRFRIVSPTATNKNNPQYLNISGLSEFQALSRSDDESLAALASYLGGIRESWRCGRGVALLVEANTTWGRGFTASEDEQKTEDACTQCLDGAKSSEGLRPLPCASTIPFPLNISRLRSESQRSRALPEIQFPTSSATRLDLYERSASADRVSPVTPTLTTAMAESMVTGMFRTLEDPRISAIGVLATDKRDHVYLAQQIARYRPNALQFTLESSILYTHPDVRSYVQGTVVASTYSLDSSTQKMTRPSSEAGMTHQFASTTSHGIYNALALVLDEPGKMIDYDLPAAPGEIIRAKAHNSPCRSRGAEAVSCSPPVWISVATRSGLLPMKADTTSYCADKKQGYAACTGLKANTDPKPTTNAGDYLGRPLIFMIGAIVCIFMVAFPMCLIRGRPVGSTTYRIRSFFFYLWKPPFRGSTDAEREVCLVALRAATALIVLWLLKLGCIWSADRLNHPAPDFQPWYAVLAMVVGLLVLFDVLARLWTLPRMGSRTSKIQVWTARVAAAVLGACIAAHAWFGYLLLGSSTWWIVGALAVVAVCADLTWPPTRKLIDAVVQWRRVPVLLGMTSFIWIVAHFKNENWLSAEPILYFQRNSLLFSLESPATFIVLSAAALFWWGAWNLRRVELLRFPEATFGLGKFLEDRVSDTRKGAVRKLSSTSLEMGRNIVIPLAGLCAVSYGSRVGVYTVEGHAFSLFVLLSSACVLTIMAHTLAHSVQLGTSVIGLLRGVARHPSVGTFKLVAQEPFSWRTARHDVRAFELEPFLRRLASIQALSASWVPLEKTSKEYPIQLLWEEVRDKLQFTPRPSRDSELGWLDWYDLNELVRALFDLLAATKWKVGFDPKAFAPAFVRALDEMEILVLFHAGVVLRDLLARLLSGFATVAGGLLLLLFAHLLYGFSGRAYWLGVDAIAFGLTAVLAVRLLIKLEKDLVLSSLWSTTPGKVNVFGALTWKAAVYIIVAIVTLLTVFFPEIFGRFGQWIEPARKLVAL